MSALILALTLWCGPSEEIVFSDSEAEIVTPIECVCETDSECVDACGGDF